MKCSKKLTDDEVKAKAAKYKAYVAEAVEYYALLEEGVIKGSADDVLQQLSEILKNVNEIHNNDPDYFPNAIATLLVRGFWLRSQQFIHIEKPDSALIDLQFADHLMPGNQDIKDAIVLCHIKIADNFRHSTQDYENALASYARAEELNGNDNEHLQEEINSSVKLCREAMREFKRGEETKPEEVRNYESIKKYGMSFHTGKSPKGVHKPTAKKAEVKPEQDQEQPPVEPPEYLKFGGRDSSFQKYQSSQHHSPTQVHKGHAHHLNQPGGRMGGRKK